MVGATQDSAGAATASPCLRTARISAATRSAASSRRGSNCSAPRTDRPTLVDMFLRGMTYLHLKSPCRLLLPPLLSSEYDRVSTFGLGPAKRQCRPRWLTTRLVPSWGQRQPIARVRCWRCHFMSTATITFHDTGQQLVAHNGLCCNRVVACPAPLITIAWNGLRRRLQGRREGLSPSARSDRGRLGIVRGSCPAGPESASPRVGWLGHVGIRRRTPSSLPRRPRVR